MPDITRFENEYWFLSNFFRAPFTCAALFDGTALTVEHAFQACKAPSPVRKQEILTCATPHQAKNVGRRVVLPNWWEHKKIWIMHSLVRAKFTQNVDLTQRLRATGQTFLIEGNTWGDNFWGTVDGVGLNWLGHILMLVRSEIA